LDWLHLQKSCNEHLSMAMSGSKLRKKAPMDMLPILWKGRVKAAICHLMGAPGKDIKNKGRMVDLMAYLIRKKSTVPDYRMRAACKPGNPSGIVERMSQLVVSGRQKGNGMSWSERGTTALAAIKMLCRNRQLQKWVESGSVGFKINHANFLPGNW
jgi:hypothetical protein